MKVNQRKKTYQNALKKIVEALVKGYQPEKIIIFGSFLTAKQPNDIDLFIIKKTKHARLGDRANEARNYLPNLTVPVDLVVYTPEEVEKAEKEGSILLHQVHKGKVLYGEKI